MKFAISSIEMTNYRQYKGTQKLQFTSDKSKNVAIIYGRNGSGKSNVLNAITWCLYGKEIHKKYEEIDDDNMPLINSSGTALPSKRRNKLCRGNNTSPN